MRSSTRKTRSTGSQKHRAEFWRRIASAALCLVLLGTNTAGAFALETPAAESPAPTAAVSPQPETAAMEKPEETPATTEETPAEPKEPEETPAEPKEPEETPATTEKPEEPEETPAEPEETPAATEEPEETPATTEEQEPEEKVYTLCLTHVFWFRQNGEDTSLELSQTLTLTGADFVDGLCDLNQFAESGELLTVTEAEALSVDSFDENREGSARIVYRVKDGWKLARKDSANMRFKRRSVFQGVLGDYEFTPADVVRFRLNYKYSNTGGLAGVDAASPVTVEAIPVKQTGGSYKMTWELPTVEGFRIVLAPSELNQYLVSPPNGSETAEELKEKLENGDFDVDIDKHIIYYHQQIGSPDKTAPNPAYGNRYSDDYNRAWNAARKLTLPGDTGSAEAVCGNPDPSAHPMGVEDHGANALVNPRLEVTLTEEQLTQILEDGAGLDITVYYRRNATWYTVNHWVPTALAGTLTGSEEKKNEGGTEYVRLEQETLQGRVGALTRAKAKTTAAYEQLQSVGFSQKLIENTGTVVDIDYAAADSYRVIFDTDYTYIPRQQVALGSNVDFKNITIPKRTGYTFDGWRYLKKDATPNADGEYNDTDYVDAGTKDNPELKVNEALIAAAKLTESGGVLALHLYPKWKPATTNVRVILWTEDLTGTDDVQAFASGGNTSFYSTKYAGYSKVPQTHEPQLGISDPNYSNAGSFTVSVPTDSSLLDDTSTDANKVLLGTIQTEVDREFNKAMGQANSIAVADFYTQAAFEIVHEEEGGTNYSATTASADGKTIIYVYFTRNVYTLQFHYYGAADGNDPAVATNTNGYSWGGINRPHDVFATNGDLDFGYVGEGNDSKTNNTWSGIDGGNILVPKTITIKAKYGADLRDVWPVARAVEQADNLKMISWATTRGKYCEDGLYGADSTHPGEPTIMGVYAAMGSEIIAVPNDPSIPHHLVAYWNSSGPSYYRYNHCYEVPELDVTGMQKVSIYNNNTTNEKNFLYLVSTDNAAIAQYGFNDLMRVSYDNGKINYNDVNGNYYAVRAYTSNGATKYYAVARQVETVSTNAIEKQNPSARLHMTKVNTNADHSTQYYDIQGNGNPYVGAADDPYDLYFYYNRDRYTITYMAPSNNITTATEVTLGRVELPYGAMVTQEKYGYELEYTDKNTDSAYGWTAATPEVSVCPDRHENGTATWTFKGWGLGPAGVNMQWTMDENAEAEAQAGKAFAIESNLRLYAIWEAPTYTVTFHLNGGTVKGGTDIVEEIPANTRYSASGVIPRPLRSGYTLEGWYVAGENGDITKPEKAFDFDQTIAENKHVAAKWTAVSTKTFDYTVYYLAEKLREIDKDLFKDTKVAPDPDNSQSWKTYFVLEQDPAQTEMFIENMTKNLTAKKIDGYVPKGTNCRLEPNQADGPYEVFFYYDPIDPGQHVVRFVLAGTEETAAPTLIKELVVEADQTVVTPQSAVATELKNQGYALANKAGDRYTAVDNFNDLEWIDEKGNFRSIGTLKGEAIPTTVTYLVQPIPYTITYQNEAGSPAAANAALAAVTAAANTAVADAKGKNPTQYTTRDTFTAVNPGRVYENGKAYEFDHWSLGENTTEDDGNQTFNPLTVEAGTTGKLSFIAKWKEVTELGDLTVSKTVVNGTGADQTKNFTFTVTLSDKAVSGIFGGMSFAGGVASFTLKHGESKTATGLPVGIGYTVTEAEANRDGYTTSKTGDTGTIAAGVTATAAFTNTRDAVPVRTGSLTVSKTVAGAAGETDRAFTFTVTLGDKTVSGAYGGMTFTDGAASFTLKHGESVTAAGLPIGTTYWVTEAEAGKDGYTTVSSDPRGIISETGSTAAFTNTRNAGPWGPDKPYTGVRTGDESNLALWLTIMGVSVIGLTAVLVVAARRNRTKRRGE